MSSKRLAVLAAAVMLVTLLAASAAAFAQGNPAGESRWTSHVLHIDETYVDPYFSSRCGFDVLVRERGVLTFNWNIVGKQLILAQFSVRSTLTNPETGTSVVIIGSARDVYFTWVDTLTRFKQRYTFNGLNYKILGVDGAESSAGRYSYMIDVTLDEDGNIIEIDEPPEQQTPHLSHFFSSSTEAAMCETLAQ